MPYENLLREGKIYTHRTSVREIGDLLEIAERDLRDASIKALSPDRRFATAYNAALQAATIILYAEGFRTAGIAHHSTTFQFIKAALGKHFADLADYFDRCRRKRNITDYDHAGRITDKEADDLLHEARDFVSQVRTWLGDKHPDLTVEP